MKELTVPVEATALRTPEKAAKPLEISPATAVTSAYIAKDLEKGRVPQKDTTAKLVDEVASDITHAGLPISPDEVDHVATETHEAYRAMKKKTSKEFLKEKNETVTGEINLEEYRNTMGALFDTYQLGKGAWQTVTGIYGMVDITANILGGYQIKTMANAKSRGQFWNQINRGLENLGVKNVPLNKVGEKLKRASFDKKKKGVALLLSATWPYVGGIAHTFLSRRAERSANTMFLRERVKLQQGVNERIASSLFMRDFEFLHDKPAGEIMEIINKGKDATIDLVSATYTEFIPSVIGIISQLPRQAVMGGVEFASSLIKIPILLSRAGENAKFMQTQRAEELAQWDKVNTQLMTTLSGLESARTSGSATSGAQKVLDTLARRDYIESGGLQKKLARNRSMNLFFDVMDLAMPLLDEAWKFRKATSGKNAATTNIATSAGFDALIRVTNSKSQQMEMRSAFSGLTQLYVDRIIPDIQDIKRMEDLLGKYDELDTPTGPKEQRRKPATALPSIDIRIDNLRYKDIVQNVSLDIPQGSFVTIKGPSGIGKSTLLRNMVGLYTPQEGSVTIGGLPIDSIKKYGPHALTTILGYANQSPQVMEGMTLKENLLMWSQNPVSDETVKKTMHDLGLDHLLGRLDTATKHFSGGELRRIGIARALLKDPKILILDEPTASLDEVSSRQVLAIIQKLRKERPDMTVVAITHDPVFEKISERIIDFQKMNKKEGQQASLTDHQVLEAIAKPSN